MHTLTPDKFNKFLSEKIYHRKAQIPNNWNLRVSVLPEAIDIIENSKSVSTSKGRSHYLFRPVTSNKPNNEISIEEEKTKHKDEYIEKLEGSLADLKVQVELQEEREQEALVNKEKQAKLYELGIIDSDWDFKE